MDFSSISPGFQSELAAFDTLLGSGMSTPDIVPPATGTGATTTPVSLSPVSWIPGFSGWSVTRTIALILGLICVIAALFMFKGPAIIETAKASAKDALLG